MRDRWKRMSGAHKTFSSILLLLSAFDGVMLLGDYMNGGPQIWAKMIIVSVTFLAGLAILICGLATAPPPPMRPRYTTPNPNRYKRARALLLSHLSGSQKEQYLTENKFLVAGKSGRTYVLNGNKMDYYRVRTSTGEKLCISGYDAIGCFPSRPPREDELLAIKLMIETDERRFLAKANNHGRVPNPIRRGGADIEEAARELTRAVETARELARLR